MSEERSSLLFHLESILLTLDSSVHQQIELLADCRRAFGEEDGKHARHLLGLIRGKLDYVDYQIGHGFPGEEDEGEEA